MKCDICKQSFKNAHGVRMHKLRNETCGGGVVAWGSTKGRKAKKTRAKIGKNGESGREAIRRILTDHPQGMALPQIFDGLKKNGLKVNQNYVSQAAASDPTIVRVERGVYRLKKNVLRGLTAATTAGTAVVEAAKTEAMSIDDLPREALLLRIETLETQQRALHEAHLSLLRGVFA